LSSGNEQDGEGREEMYRVEGGGEREGMGKEGYGRNDRTPRFQNVDTRIR